MKIDITGNWRDDEGFKPHIRTHKPWLKGNDKKSFFQELSLPPGRYTLELEYRRHQDIKEAFFLYGNYKGNRTINETAEYNLLSINEALRPLSFISLQPEGEFYTAKCDFEATAKSNKTRLRLDLYNTRPLRTRLECQGQFPSAGKYFAIKPEEQGEYLLAHGIPFRARKIDLHPLGFRSILPFSKFDTMDRGSLFEWREGMRMNCGGVAVKTAYFLGMIHNFDFANGSWYCPKGDHGYSHFAGDQAGDISIKWKDGNESVIPLIFGFNLWYSKPWDVLWHGVDRDRQLFCNQNECRDIIQNNLRLADGMRVMGSDSCNARYVFSVDMDNRTMESITVRGVPELHGHPVISAVTLESGGPCAGGLEQLPSIYNGAPDIHPVTLGSISNKEYAAGVEKIMRELYTFADELPELKNPEIPAGYFGPAYDFRGKKEAVYAATYLYYNGPECAAHIADSGTGCSSSTAKWSLAAAYMLGLGVWTPVKPMFDGLSDWFKKYQAGVPGQFPGLNMVWSRGAGELLREAMAFGYDKYVNTYVDWLDRVLFSDANPPHWNRMPGNPDVCTYRVKVGDVEEKGNRENDGHGICMWGRYLVWHGLGRPGDWNVKHWPATKASVEWIQWQLDNDTLYPGTRKDVLFTDSECAYAAYDMYSSYNCLHGLKLAIRMAEQLGKAEDIKRWRILYQRLRRGILDHLVDVDEQSPIWHTEANCDWQDHAHKLCHLHLATEGDTYTPLDDYRNGDELDRRYLEIDLNTYRTLMRGKNYDCLRMYGYGQGMMTQAALLLDEMEDAGHFIDKLVTCCYLPKFGRWISPEGIILHRSGRYYLPVNGYMGQDSHLADSAKAIRLMLGIDDNRPEQLRIVPRYPAGWDSMAISNFPVLTGCTRQKLGYTYVRNAYQHQFSFRLEQPVADISIRLGPVPAKAKIKAASYNNQPVPFEHVKAGDSHWLWFKQLAGRSGELAVSSFAG